QPELNPRVKQPQVARLERDERLGAFLETAVSALNQQVTAVLEQAQGYLSKDDILAIPGLTKTSREAIETYFADLETAETEDA
ncbi:MAG: hypothetical protein KC415_19795, partial [Anaerolineales bacterium]|nr:hypothetical protein [Anaerolineales bacterium]